MDHAQLLSALDRAAKRRQDASAVEQAAAAVEHEALVAALRGGVPLANIVEATDYSREKLRRIARDANVPLRRAPTVVSKRQVESDQPE